MLVPRALSGCLGREELRRRDSVIAAGRQSELNFAVCLHRWSQCVMQALCLH